MNNDILLLHFDSVLLVRLDGLGCTSADVRRCYRDCDRNCLEQISYRRCSELAGRYGIRHHLFDVGISPGTPALLIVVQLLFLLRSSLFVMLSSFSNY
jgi:hypothetical protein